ncbi:MAG: STAS domain-containing protein [Treponema sp.]|nr:STAS domain-containing protein [Treponema sp.]
MDNDLEVKKEVGPESVKITIAGRIYSSNADLLEMHLGKTLGEKQFNIVLNMSQVEYISSIGIRVILKTFLDARKAGGKLEIEMPSAEVRKVLKIAALDQMLIQPTAQGNT